MGGIAPLHEVALAIATGLVHFDAVTSGSNRGIMHADIAVNGADLKRFQSGQQRVNTVVTG